MKSFKIAFFVILFLILFINIMNVTAKPYDNGLVNGTVYYNDQEATVFDAVLKVGEPFTIKAVFLLKKNVDISTGLSASGFDVRANSQPFEIISFPDEFSPTAKIANNNVGYTKTVREWNHTAGETVEIKWILKPTEVGKGWTIPLNIAFNFYDRDKRKEVPFSFTVANIEIKNEYYAGASSPQHSLFNPQNPLPTQPHNPNPPPSPPRSSPSLRCLRSGAGGAGK